MIARDFLFHIMFESWPRGASNAPTTSSPVVRFCSALLALR